MYHSFSIAKRSLSQMALKVMHKDKGNVTVQVQKYVKGNWINIGYKKTIKPRTDDYIDINKVCDQWSSSWKISCCIKYTKRTGILSFIWNK